VPDITSLVSTAALEFLFLLSIVGFVGSVIAIPWILIRLPQDYFCESHPRTWLKDRHPVLRLIALALKNFVGWILLLGGIAMLVLPGQGLLTILIGVSLMDFPGKRAIERKLVSRPLVLQAINRVRQRFDRPPLLIEEHAVHKT
jgi:Putative transmembrane protein (PGPGW)